MRSAAIKTLAFALTLGLAAPVTAQPGHGSLPPGLAKKAYRGEPLPPGWKKKIYPGAYLDHDLYSHAHLISGADRDGYMVVRIEDETLRLVAATLQIVDILD